MLVSWFEAIVVHLERLIKLFTPFRVARSYRRAIVFRWGQPHRVCTGFFWMWPCKIEEAEFVIISVETRNLLTQTMTTKDEKVASFSANITFKVVDPVKYYCEVFDFETALDAVAMTHLASRVREKSWAELQSDQKDLEQSLKNTLTTRVKDWGVVILSVGFTDFVQTKAYRLFGDTGADNRNQKSTLAAYVS
jgi:regulator of protease activity HflC (stomatin/prohibitin superfamily)